MNVEQKPLIRLDECDRPIFLLGSGRCASTWWQALLCRSRDIWIWGEHAGFLSDLVRSKDKIQNNDTLFKLGSQGLNVERWDKFYGKDATAVAWMNSFQLTEYENYLASFISQIFKAGVPNGKKRWGFKEIRYGFREDLVVNFLLKEFRGSTIVHTLRHPRTSIASWVKIRIKILGKLQKKENEIRKIYDQEAQRFLVGNEGLIDFKIKYPERVQRVFIEDRHESIKRLEAFLGTNLDKKLPKINKSRYSESGELDPILSDLWLGKKDAFREMLTTLGYDENDYTRKDKLRY
jgi:hypothetical protein